MTMISKDPEWTTLDDLRAAARQAGVYGVYHLLRDGELYGVLGHSPLEMCCLCVQARDASFMCPTGALPEPMEWSEAAPIIERWRGKDPGCGDEPEEK